MSVVGGTIEPMSDHVVRLLRPDEYRGADDLFRRSLHLPLTSDEAWPVAARGYQPDRTFGAFDTTLVGTARSTDVLMVVPGGASVPAAAVTGVGVRPDRTRRGILTELMRAQLHDAHSHGCTLAALYSTEGTIYGRFGYGVGTHGRSCTVRRRRAHLRAEAPTGGQVELLEHDAAIHRLPQIYDELTGVRAGQMSRPSYWWASFEARHRGAPAPALTVVHHDADGPDGFVSYTVSGHGRREPTMLQVTDLHAGSTEAFAGLWRYLLGVDLVDEITLSMRPVDEPVELFLVDPRGCQVTGVDDEIWVRIIDVDHALLMRTYGQGALVLDVVDPLLEANSGRYLIDESGAGRTNQPADLRVGVDALSMMYFGSARPSALVAAGRAEATSADVVPVADRMFATGPAAWCGTFF